MTTNRDWLRLLDDVIEHGVDHAPRGLATRELLANTTSVAMNQPVVTVTERKLGHRFLAAESAWILSGDNRLSTIAPYARRIVDTCDDGLTFRGAYGPPFVDQVGYVLDTLVDDPSSRRALLTLWRPRPAASLDYACTTQLQWLFRGQQLHCVATMRSSDVWLGVPYDYHTFSMMSLHVLVGLRRRAPLVFGEARLGTLFLTAGSQHLYERDLPAARRCLEGASTAHALAPVDERAYRHPDELTEHLWRVARREPTRFTWLTDLPGIAA